MKNVQKGFTLIELMIVVAIIAILAAIAIPQYQNYITKSQFSESQTIADGLKTPVVEYFNQTGTCPSNGTTGFYLAASYSGKYVASTTIGGGAGPCTIMATFKPTGSVSAPLNAKTATLTGNIANGGTIVWACTSSVDPKYLPKVCQP